MLKDAGISAEIIDPRTLKPLPVDALVASVKTGRLLVVDHGHETLGTAAEIIASVAIGVPGAKVARSISRTHRRPAQGDDHRMTPDADKIVQAAKVMMG